LFLSVIKTAIWGAICSRSRITFAGYIHRNPSRLVFGEQLGG
jgi:hypothetical protein